MQLEDRLNRILYWSGQVPTFPSTKYKSEGTWLPSDLSLGQFAINVVDKKIWYCAENEIVELSLTGGTGGDSTYIQNGLNTYTGGTSQYPTVNISAATLDSLYSTTLSGGTILSGATDLYSIFQPLGVDAPIYDKRTEWVSLVLMYQGFAPQGSAESDAVWTIFKIVTLATGGVVSNTEFTDKKWTERGLL